MIKKIFFTLIVAFMFCKATCQNIATVPESIKTSKKVMNDFMDKRFGMFIHWGPVTLRGKDISWSRGGEIPTADYDSLYKEFDPVLFNADDWVKTARDAGMKYLTITAKHHDGFCLWPSKYSRHTIAYTPYKKDIIGALAKSCKKFGIKFCIYYSVLDWFNPDYPLHSPNDKAEDPKANMPRYITYMKNQLKELITNYDPYMMWFDGAWESPWTNEMAVDMYAYLKSLKKDLIINNRLGKEIAGVENKDIDVSKMIGDYDTPEQTVGRMNMNTPWESCITICTNWSWVPNDKIKSLQQCIRTLASTAGGNGNLLLNVSPMMDGRMEARQVNRLKEMGEWLKENGRAIYDTKGGPYKPNDLFSTTRKNNKIYVSVKTDTTLLSLKPLPQKKIIKAYFLNGKEVSFLQDSSRILIKFPTGLPDKNCTEIVLELDSDAEDIPVIE
ncbi:MAG: alpha-L-fucosidase [Ferruginibacter sp.]